MAKAVAPYIHARKQQVEVQGGVKVVRIIAPDPDASMAEKKKLRAVAEAARALLSAPSGLEPMDRLRRAVAALDADSH